MSQTTTMTVRLSDDLSDFVAANVGETGTCQYVSEYNRDLIRRDMERVEQQSLDRLKAKLKLAFSMPDASHKQMTAVEIIARNRT